MRVVVYLIVSAGVLLIAFVILLVIAGRKSSGDRKDRKKSQSYNTSVIRRHILSKPMKD